MTNEPKLEHILPAETRLNLDIVKIILVAFEQCPSSMVELFQYRPLGQGIAQGHYEFIMSDGQVARTTKANTLEYFYDCSFPLSERALKLQVVPLQPIINMVKTFNDWK